MDSWRMGRGAKLEREKGMSECGSYSRRRALHVLCVGLRPSTRASLCESRGSGPRCSLAV
eukprot:8895225-Pyramimonas_sp.AAC.1